MRGSDKNSLALILMAFLHQEFYSSGDSPKSQELSFCFWLVWWVNTFFSESPLPSSLLTHGLSPKLTQIFLAIYLCFNHRRLGRMHALVSALERLNAHGRMSLNTTKFSKPGYQKTWPLCTIPNVICSFLSCPTNHFSLRCAGYKQQDSLLCLFLGVFLYFSCLTSFFKYFISYDFNILSQVAETLCFQYLLFDYINAFSEFSVHYYNK